MTLSLIVKDNWLRNNTPWIYRKASRSAATYLTKRSSIKAILALNNYRISLQRQMCFSSPPNTATHATTTSLTSSLIHSKMSPIATLGNKLPLSLICLSQTVAHISRCIPINSITNTCRITQSPLELSKTTLTLWQSSRPTLSRINRVSNTVHITSTEAPSLIWTSLSNRK